MKVVDRRALPLLLASARFASDAETEPLDRLRMQKGVFLLEMNGPAEWRDLYPFKPYDWGPFSRDLIRDLPAMAEEGLITEERLPRRGYPAYRTTEPGEMVVADALRTLPPTRVEFVRRVRQFVTTRAFSRLLRDVYEVYPEYALKSRFSG